MQDALHGTLTSPQLKELAQAGVLDRLARLAAHLLQAPLALVLSPDHDQLRVLGQFGLWEPLASHREWPAQEFPFNSPPPADQPLVVHQTTASPPTTRLFLNSPIASYLTIPILSPNHQLLAHFWILDRTPRSWQPGEIGLLSELAACAVHELLYHSQLHHQLQLTSKLHAQQRLELIGTLAAGHAHELGNLLAGMLAHLELAQNPQFQSHLDTNPIDIATKTCQRARKLVQRTLRLARQDPEPRITTSLLPILEESLQLLHSSLPGEIELLSHLSTDTPPVHHDPTQIEQVILNLIINAWQAIEPSRGQIHVTLDSLIIPHPQSQNPEPTAFPETAPTPGIYSRIRVSDSGPGIPTDQLARIFDPFFTTKPPGQSSGLGLSIVRNIIQEHGGTITVQSQLNQGTTFTILLPRSESTPDIPPAPTSPSSPRPFPSKAARILVLDDDPWFVDLAVRTLKQLGHLPQGHTQVQQALSAVRSAPQHFDVIVTDASMPVCSGPEFIQQLQSVSPRASIVLTTGCITDSLLSQTKPLGVHHILTKPGTIDEFSQAITTVLDSLHRPNPRP